MIYALLSRFKSLLVRRSIYQLALLLRLPVAWDISAGLVVYRTTPAGRQYLLLYGRDGNLDFAKGHLEVGETELAAARRECAEETGIAVVTVAEEHDLRIRYSYVAGASERTRRQSEGKGWWVLKQVVYYPAQTSSDTVVISDEHQGYEWLTYEQALERIVYPNARWVIQETERFLAVANKS